MSLVLLLNGITHLVFFVTYISRARMVLGGSCIHIPAIERVDTDKPLDCEWDVNDWWECVEP